MGNQKMALKEQTSRIYNTINTEFKNKFGVPFSEGLIYIQGEG